jgi:tetratricopeptide (TPR) repeat protein
MDKLTVNIWQALKRAISAFNAGKLVEAEQLCLQIINAKRDLFDALHLLAVVQSRLGKKETALASYDRALKVRPDFAEALFNRGLALHALERFEEALASYDRSLTLLPDYSKALFNRGDTLHELKRFEEALRSYDRALTLRPDYAEALCNRGLTLHELKRFEEAVASYDRALTLWPNFAEALSNRGATLHELKRFEEALTSYDRAVALRPGYAKALFNRGVTLNELKRFEEALASYDRAVTLRPHYAEAHWNEALMMLLTGDFSRGWLKYEWRWKNDSITPNRNFSQPLWLGADAIDGKSILLYCEQGLGDAVQFCRYVPLVAARGARVILEVDRSLHELMSTLAGATQVISRGDALPDFDLQCPLLSLPLAFETRHETIPAVTPYLHAPIQASKYWQTRLGPKARPRIGIVWSGSPRHKNDQNRSISLRSLIPLLDIEATFVSLQKDVRADDVMVLQERSDVLHFGDALEDFSDTAALISNLDLVISVDTSVAHLAGALAKPCWVLLPSVPDWRWMLDREDSPWYPTVRLFRQEETRAWDNVIAHVHAALLELVQYRS